MAGTWVRILLVVLAFLVTVPGLWISVLYLMAIIQHTVEGQMTRYAAYPLTYSLAQLLAYASWFAPGLHRGRTVFAGLTAATVLASIGLIVEIQRQIIEYDGFCGNPVMGMMFIQIAAAGTIAGFLVLPFDATHWRKMSQSIE